MELCGGRKCQELKNGNFNMKVIKCTEFCKLVGLPEETCGCWGCHESYDIGEGQLHLISSNITGLPGDSLICCWVKMEYKKHINNYKEDFYEEKENNS